MPEVSPDVFWILSTIILGGALVTVLSHNLFHAALGLITSFVGVAGLYFALYSPFMAVLQVLVYSGAIAVVLLFAFMLTDNIMGRKATHSHVKRSLLAVAVLGWMLYYAIDTFQPLFYLNSSQSLEVFEETRSLPLLGRSFLAEHVVSFELASVLLLLALIGAVYIACKEEPEYDS